MLWLKVLFFFSLLVLIVVFVTYISKQDMVDDDEPIEYGSVELVATIVDTTFKVPDKYTILGHFCLDNELFEIVSDGEGGHAEVLVSIYDQKCIDLSKEDLPPNGRYRKIGGKVMKHIPLNQKMD